MYQPDPRAALQGELTTGWECFGWEGGQMGKGYVGRLGRGSGICEAVEETRAVLAFLT